MAASDLQSLREKQGAAAVFEIPCVLTDPYENYLKKNAAVACALKISNQAIKDLREIMSKDEEVPFSLVNAINLSIGIISMKSTNRLEERFASLIRTFSSEWKKISRKGEKARNEYLNSERKVHLFSDEVHFVCDVEAKLKNLQKDVILSDRRQARLYNALLSCSCESAENTQKNLSSKYDDVSSKQRRRKREELKIKANSALWFAESYGIKPQYLVCESAVGETFRLDFTIMPQKYEDLPSKEKEKLKDLVYILDKFGISNQTYHEIQQLTDDLPIKSCVEKCRLSLSKQFKRMPGGMMVNSIKQEVHDIITAAVANKSYELGGDKPFMLKFGGDGTQVSRISTFITFSLSHIDVTETSGANQCSSLQRVVAIGNGHESYESMKRDFFPMFSEINELLSNPTVTVSSHERQHDVNLQVFLGSDMKMISNLMGLKAASAEQSCPWCIEKASSRYVLPKSVDQYHLLPYVRNITNMIEKAKDGKFDEGMKHPPLVHIQVDRIVPDTLHMMMRITDVLERNLIDEAYELDHQAAVTKSLQNNVSNLKKAICSCGVSFEIWSSSDTRSSRDYQWTSLTGKQKVKLLQLLPNKLPGILHSETEQSVIKLWKKFYIIYEMLNSDDCSCDSSGILFKMSSEWLSLFLSLGSKRKGYNKSNVTPYMHVLVGHVPFFVKLVGNLKYYCGQGLEKTMDDIKQIFRKKTNKSDACHETLAVRKRIEQLHIEKSQRGSQKRAYQKKDMGYWETEKAAKSGRKKERILGEIAEVTPEENVESMSTEDLRKKLGILGYRTKLRDRKKLISLLLSIENKEN